MSAITPDGFAGALVAAESISDARVILHGPGGCRFRYMRLSQELYSRGDDGIDYDLPYFFNKSRVPCTYIDDNDYIGGGFSKIRDALEVVAGVDDSLIVVLNSPGMALIGDDVSTAIAALGLEDRAMTIEENLVSLPASSGYDRMLTAIMEKVSPVRKEVRKGTVNILGMSVMGRDWVHGLEELKHILGLMDLDVISAPGAGCTLEDLSNSADAEFNVCVMPEFCHGMMEFYSERYGIPTCVSPSGAPVGFDATRDWIMCIAETTGHDPTAALAYVDSFKTEAKRIMLSDVRRVNNLRTKTFSIRGECSVVRPLTFWLFDYLAMMPKAVMTEDTEVTGESESFREELASKGLSHVFGRDLEPADYMAGPGDVTKMYCLGGNCLANIDLGFPPTRAFDFMYSSVLGARGAMYILARLLND